MSIYTIGHSNHPISKFLALLAKHNIEVLADVRILPRSRFNPQFNDKALSKTLAGNNISYLHFIDLGGHRKPQPDSRNMAIRSESFRGYADHMLSAEFQNSANKIIEISAQKNIVTMCAEAKPSQCHRSYLADYFLVNGHEVFHILPDASLVPHKLNKFAVADSHEVIYPLPLFA